MNPTAFMNHLSQRLESRFNGSKASALQPLEVLIIYEGAVSCARTRQLYNDLIKHGPVSCSCETYRWDLQHPELLSALAEAVSMADMIVVCGDTNSHLPKEISQALSRGLRDRRVEDGAIVLVTAAVRGKTPVNERLLRRMADDFGLEFFVGDFPMHEEPPLSFDEIHERAETITPHTRTHFAALDSYNPPHVRRRSTHGILRFWQHIKTKYGKCIVGPVFHIQRTCCPMGG